MSGRCHPNHARVLWGLASAASLGAMALGVSVLIGWQLDSPVLKSFIPDQSAMNPIAAIVFILLGGALWLQRKEPTDRYSQRWARGLALAAAVIGVSVMAEYLIGWGPHLDQTVFRAQVEQASPPNRMAPNTALEFLLIGTSLLLLNAQSQFLQRSARFLALSSLAIAFLPAIGYLYQIAPFTRAGADYGPMPLNAALGIMMLAFGVLGVRPERGIMALLCSNRSGGQMLRRLLPAFFLAPILLGLLRLWGERTWGYDDTFGVGLLVTGMIAVTTSLLWWHSGVLDRVEAALIDSEAKLRTVIDASPDIVMMRDREGRYLLANPAYAKMLGRSIPEILGKRDTDLYEDATAQRIMASDRNVMATETPATYEIEILTPDGEDRIFYSTKYPYYSPAGELIGVIAISRDITDRQKIEEALRESQRRIEAVLDNSPVFLLNVDLHGRILLAKGKGLEVLCLNPSDMIGQDIAEAFQMFPAFAWAYHRALAGESFREPVEVGTAAFEAWFTPVRSDETDRIVGVIGVATDVSERKQLEAQLRAQYEKLKELDKLKDDFVNAVSHDLRTPLTAIMGYAEFLEDEIGGKLTPQQGEFVAQIEKSTQRLEGLVNDLLDFARLEAGKFRLHCEEVDLANKIAEIVESLRPQAEERMLKLEAILPDEPVPMVLDPRRIERVLANLIGNAIKFTPEGGQIGVRVTVEENGVICEVTDTGIGIASEDIPKLFRRFTQLESGARIKAGTGLGLSISKAQVEAHGGQVGVRSELGKGSTFWFRLHWDVPAQCRVDQGDIPETATRGSAS